MDRGGRMSATNRPTNGASIYERAQATNADRDAG